MDLCVCFGVRKFYLFVLVIHSKMYWTHHAFYVNCQSSTKKNYSKTFPHRFNHLDWNSSQQKTNKHWHEGVCWWLTLNAEHLPQFQRSPSDFAQSSDDAFSVGLRQEGARVQNRFLIFAWEAQKIIMEDLDSIRKKDSTQQLYVFLYWLTQEDVKYNQADILLVF